MAKVLKTVGLALGAATLGLYLTGRSGSKNGIINIYAPNDHDGKVQQAIDTINERLLAYGV